MLNCKAGQKRTSSATPGTSYSTMAEGFEHLVKITWTEEERRSAIVMILVRNGDSLGDSDIADLLGVDRRRVNELRHALKETRDPRQVIARAPKAPMAARKVRSREFIENVRIILKATPDRSFRSIAKELNVSHFTVRQCVNEDLRCKSNRKKRKSCKK